MPETRPYGSWRSPIDASLLTRGARGFGLPRLDGADVYYTESRPAEGGRVALMRRSPGRAPEEVTGPGVNVRTGVHEYGGADVYWTEYFRVHAASTPERRILESITSNTTGRPVIAQLIGNDMKVADDFDARKFVNRAIAAE